MSPAIAAVPEFDLPTSRHAEAIVRAIESSASVRRRSQFFIWSQSQLATLVPHQLAVCGAYQRIRKDFVFDAFYTVAVPADALAQLLEAGSPIMRQLIATWGAARGRCVQVDLRALFGKLDHRICSSLLDAGYEHLLVHGVTRPQRPAELESLFILTSRDTTWSEQQCLFFELLLPHLHTTYQRVTINEREFGPPQAKQAGVRVSTGCSSITERERQILLWVREGMSNHQIGHQLDISALTVKNHVQKILRKLGAANRAQAVAMAISQNLMEAANGQHAD